MCTASPIPTTLGKPLVERHLLSGYSVARVLLEPALRRSVVSKTLPEAKPLTSLKGLALGVLRVRLLSILDYKYFKEGGL